MQNATPTKRGPGRPRKAQTDTRSPQLPRELVLFDQLPDSAYVRLPVVMGLFACSSSWVWRGVREGRFPAPRKLAAQTTGWNVGELRAVLAAARDE